MAGAFLRMAEKTQGTYLFFFFFFFSQSRLCCLSYASKKASVRGSLFPLISKDMPEAEKKRVKQTKRRKLDFPHSEPVTYLFCKDAFCTNNNKAAVR